MTPEDIIRVQRRLMELATAPDTSNALRSYVEAAGSRDPVDVLNEIDVLSGLLTPKLVPADVVPKTEGEP